MENFKSLKNKHNGRIGIILGGGPSLVSDFEKCPENTIRVAANHHGYMAGIYPIHYMLFLDNPDDTEPLTQIVSEVFGTETTCLSPHSRWSNYEFHDSQRYRMVSSGLYSCWVSWYLGCRKILLCGMDLYEKNNTNEQIKQWEVVNSLCVGSRLFAMSGPLSEVFPPFENIFGE